MFFQRPIFLHYAPGCERVVDKWSNRYTWARSRTVNIDSHYLIGSGDFDQCIHLIQAATIFLPWHTAQTDSVCILVGQKFNVAPRRHFEELSDTEEMWSFIFM